MKEIITENEVSRRSVLKGAAAGAAADEQPGFTPEQFHFRNFPCAG